ncbi:MAG: MATE family efflux transporter [Bacteroidetes bacterium]|nr:MAG: MATE family efflux transporter [Bacteroidota bacterium]
MRDLTKGPEGKQILLFALPMLLGNVFQQLYYIVDTLIIGHYLGTEALAAAGASFPVIFVLISLMIGITTGINVVISQYFGNKNYVKVKRAIDTAFIFLFVSSLGLSVLGLVFSEQIFRLIGLPEELLPQAMQYFNVYVSGLIFMSGYNGVSAILRGMGDSKTPLYFLIISTFLNIGFDLLFVAVFKWGIAGISFATVLAQAIAFGLSVIYLNRYHPLIKFSFTGLSFDREIFRQSLRIGIPTGLQHTFVSLGMAALMTIVNMFGTPTIAAYSIAWRIDSFATLPAMNFGMALSTFVGQNIGANKIERVRKGLIACLAMTTGYSFLVTIVAWTYGKTLMGFFTDDQLVIDIGYDYLVIVSSFYIVFGAMFLMHGTLRGAGDTLIPMFITLFSLWVLRVPFSYYLSQHMGETGIWWGIPIAWVFGLVATFLYYKTGRWKKKAVIKHNVSDPDALEEKK